jgi:hypothetical protein
MSTVVVFAHLGHWYVGLPVYLGPVLALVASVKVAEWRDRHRAGGRGPRKREEEDAHADTAR